MVTWEHKAPLQCGKQRTVWLLNHDARVTPYITKGLGRMEVSLDHTRLLSWKERKGISFDSNIGNWRKTNSFLLEANSQWRGQVVRCLLYKLRTWVPSQAKVTLIPAQRNRALASQSSQLTELQVPWEILPQGEKRWTGKIQLDVIPLASNTYNGQGHLPHSVLYLVFSLTLYLILNRWSLPQEAHPFPTSP